MCLVMVYREDVVECWLEEDDETRGYGPTDEAAIRDLSYKTNYTVGDIKSEYMATFVEAACGWEEV